MFKAPFSFEGRIRRLEYGLGFFVLIVAGGIASLTWTLLMMVSQVLGLFVMAATLIAFVWFGWAQNAKRCHDLGNSGWFQLIPFYGLFLLFQDGDIGVNEYGPNPKGIGNDEGYEEQINEIGKSLEQ